MFDKNCKYVDATALKLIKIIYKLDSKITYRFC